MTLTTVKTHLTFVEYLNYDDGTDNHYELVEGKLQIMNPPTIKHFLIAKFIERFFESEINRLQLDWFCFRETGVKTTNNTSRLTDVCIVTSAQTQELLNQSAIFETPPLLVVEVVSPESIKRDYRYKRTEYSALRIPEYWIVDPIESQILVLIWDEGLYEQTIFTGENKIISPTFPELNLTVNQVLNAGNF
jgi:Uma2 family endonuclease